MKKNMKKFFALITALTMVFSMAACSSESDDTGSNAGTSGGEPMTIKIGTVNYEGSVQVRALEVFKDTIEKASNGRITVEIYAGSVLGNNEVKWRCKRKAAGSINKRAAAWPLFC